MFNKISIKNFYNQSNLYEKSVVFLPVALILGNLAINLNVLLIIVFFVYEKKKYLKEFFLKNKPQIYFYLFFLFFCILNIFFSESLYFSVKGFLGIIKHIMLFIALIYFFEKKENLIQLSFIFFLTLNFVLFDTLIQYFLGADIFGYKIKFIESIDLVSFRLSGPFGDEYIVGGYLKSIFLISTLIFFYKRKIFFLLFYIFSTVLVILLSGERSSGIMFLFFIMIIIFFFDTSFKKKTLLFVGLFSILLSFFTLNENLRKSSFERTFKQLGFEKSEHSYKDHKNFFDSQWGAHFLTAYEIFKDNKLVGTGIKNFRVVCSDIKYSDINSVRSNVRCSTHPHNIYLEILSETGLIGFTLFVFALTYVLRRQLIRTLSSKSEYYFFNLGLLAIFLTLIWPIQTTGSFFSTYNGFFYWFYSALIYSKKYYFNENKNLHVVKK